LASVYSVQRPPSHQALPAWLHSLSLASPLLLRGSQDAPADPNLSKESEQQSTPTLLPLMADTSAGYWGRTAWSTDSGSMEGQSSSGQCVGSSAGECQLTETSEQLESRPALLTASTASTAVRTRSSSAKLLTTVATRASVSTTSPSPIPTALLLRRIGGE
jgi:hypothetical protein